MIKLAPNVGAWTSIFKSLKKVCKETRLSEFQFKRIHRVVIALKEICKFGITTDDKCLFCGDKDSIEHTFIECPFTPQWFYEANCCQISPTTDELLFCIVPSSKETKLIYKFNYITLSMRHYIHVYSNKINSKGI